MKIKNVIFHNPATIVIWDDNTKTVVKVNKDDAFDAETGLAMAITKKYVNSAHWKQIFMITTTDDKIKGKLNKQPIGDEKTVAMMHVRAYYEHDEHKPNWYKEFTRWLPKKVEEQPVLFVSESVKKAPLSDYEKVINLFNAGCSIKRISKETGITEYYVRKYIDAATNPKASKGKAARILNKALKPRKPRGSYTRRTQIEFPDYLDQATCESILEATKDKYKDNPKALYMSELQKHFNSECKKHYISTHYANGYDMYAIAKVIGTSAASVQKMWNAMQRGEKI